MYEINRLYNWLMEHKDFYGWDIEKLDHHPHYSFSPWYQVIIYDKDDELLWDAVWHSFSYGFDLSYFACEKLGCRTYDYDDYLNLDRRIQKSSRTDEKLINFIETYGTVRCSGKHAAIVIVEIPDEATDWEIGDYDGIEYVTYVIDCKIHHA